MKVVGFITTFLIATVLGTLWSGYVLSVLWHWFIAPVFGAPEMSVGYAIGIALVVGHLTTTQIPSQKDKSTTEMLTVALAMAFFRPALTLLYGWVVYLFIS